MRQRANGREEEAWPSGGGIDSLLGGMSRTWDESKQIQQTLNNLSIKYGTNKGFLGLGTMHQFASTFNLYFYM